VLPGDELEPGAHRLLREEEDQREHDRGLDRGEDQLAREVAGSVAERGQQDQERDDREILEEQDPHHVAPVRCGELHALGEHLGDDRGRAHRPRGAERQSGLPAEPEERKDDDRSRGGDRDLREAEAEHRPAHRLQLREAELEPDGEHQEHDAEFGEVPGLDALRDPRERVRADRHADQQVAEDRRQPDHPAQGDDDHRAPQQHQYQLQRRRHGDAVYSAG
jgi:hypothetical protein